MHQQKSFFYENIFFLFWICYIFAETPAAASSAAPAAAAKEEKEAKKEEEKETKKEAEPEKKSDSSETPMEVAAPTSGSGGGTGSDLVVGEDYNLMVQNIMDMGYGRDEVSQFLIANNVLFVPKWQVAIFQKAYFCSTYTDFLRQQH